MNVRLILWLLVLGAILAVGLWPFDFVPKNSAAWNTNPPGLRFSPYGIAYAQAPLTLHAPADKPQAMTVELWLEPSRYDFGDYAEILSLYRPAHSDWFTISKAGPNMFLDGRWNDGESPSGIPRLRIYDVFRWREPEFFSIVTGPSGTYVYRDDVLLEAFPLAKPFPQTLGGELVIGNSPIGHSAWSGTLFGVAIYERELGALEVAQDRQLWIRRSLPQLAAKPGIVALFPFNEGSGTHAGNQISGSPGLQIPARLDPPHQGFLAWPSRRSFHRVRDVTLNILALVPFGFLAAGYFHASRGASQGRSALLATLAGLAVSLTIEILQVYLPSRDSSLTDVINNTLGSGVGAVLWMLGTRVWRRQAR